MLEVLVFHKTKNKHTFRDKHLIKGDSNAFSFLKIFSREFARFLQIAKVWPHEIDEFLSLTKLFSTKNLHYLTHQSWPFRKRKIILFLIIGSFLEGKLRIIESYILRDLLKKTLGSNGIHVLLSICWKPRKVVELL